MPHCTNIFEFNSSTYVFYVYYIYIYICICLSTFFKCTFHIINFSALSTLSITLENYKRNAVKFVSFIYISFMPLKCYYIYAAPNKEQAWQADASAWESHSRELADLFPHLTERSFFFISLFFRSKPRRCLSKASYRRYDRSSEIA